MITGSEFGPKGEVAEPVIMYGDTAFGVALSPSSGSHHNMISNGGFESGSTTTTYKYSAVTDWLPDTTSGRVYIYDGNSAWGGTEVVSAPLRKPAIPQSRNPAIPQSRNPAIPRPLILDL